MGVHCTKFDKGSKDIERTSLGLQATDRPFQSCHKNDGPALTPNSANLIFVKKKRALITSKFREEV